MSYTAATVARVIEHTNRSYYLPAIQRPYVWETDQIIALFDSLMKGYPISTFLLWEIKPENRSNWEMYKFIEHFKYGQTHNELVEPDGRDVTLVLDGQQRLTSLLIGLRGTYTIKLKHKRWDNPSAWSRQRLFIDLFKDPGTEDEEDREDIGITYGLKFSAEELKSDTHHLWFKVGRILDFDSEDEFDRFKDSLIDSLPGNITRDQERLARRTLERLFRVVWKDEVISYYTEKNQSYDRVLDIFIRANDGGTKLSKSDLLLSMITSKWEGLSAREEIYNFVSFLNEELIRKNDLDKDFIMKSCLVLSDLDQRYQVNNFTSNNLALIQENWAKIKLALEATIRLVNRLGIDRDTLTSTNALMPISYYLYKINSGYLDGTTPFEINNVERIRRWIIGSLLNNVFGGNSDSTIGSARAILRKELSNSRDFPHKALAEGLKLRGRITNFDDANVEALLDIRYGARTSFLGLSLLYDSHNWGSSIYHIDHIIPRSLASRRNLMALNIPETRIERILECSDRIGNLQLLLARENVEKGAMSFEDWIQTRDSSFLQLHLIPDDRNLWSVLRLPEFVEAREELIRKRLARLNGDVGSDSSDHGDPPGNLHATALA